MINNKVVTGILKELGIAKVLCNNVKIKPNFCSALTGISEAHINKGIETNRIIYVLIFMLIFVNISMFFMCRAYILEKINDRVKSGSIDIDGRINNVINNYFALKNNNNDYKAFDSKNQVIEMKEGNVNTI